MLSEREQAVAALRPVGLRRLGQRRVHLALVLPASITEASRFGSPCRVVSAPASALCRTTLRGRLVVVPFYDTETAYRRGGLCPVCARWWESVVRLADLWLWRW